LLLVRPPVSRSKLWMLDDECLLHEGNRGGDFFAVRLCCGIGSKNPGTVTPF